MKAAAIPRPGRSAWLIGRGVFIELIRRKDAYVLGFLMSIFVLGVWAVGQVGVENPSTGTFLLNLGLTLAWFFAHVLTLVVTARQIPGEIENRTVYPLLARPLDRHVLVLGKWGACTVCGAAVFGVLFLLVWVFTPQLEFYDPGLLFQALLLQPLSLGMLAALAVLLSLVVPRGAAVVLAGAVVFFGSSFAPLVGSWLAGTSVSSLAEWGLLYLPDFSKLNLFTRYTDGMGALSGTVFAGLLLYGSIFSAFCLALSTHLFKRRAL